MNKVSKKVDEFFYKQGNNHYVGGFSPRGNVAAWLLLIAFVLGVSFSIAGLIQLFLN